MPLNADQRGDAGPNGKPSLTVDEAADNLIRSSGGWSAVRGQPTTLTYAFRQVAPADLPSDIGGFSAFTAAQVAAAERALLAWSDVAGVTFQRVDFGSNATLLFGNYRTGQEGAAAFAYYPGGRAASDISGDVWVNITLSSNTDLGRGGQGDFILVHEIGHALGLAHPGQYDANGDDVAEYGRDALYYEDTRVYSVMSYFGSVNTGTVQPEGSALFANAPQLDDVAAIQRLYGANTATRAGDTVYGFNSNTDRTWYTLTSPADGMYASIWDGGGSDTFDFSRYTQNQRIDLRQGAFSDVGPNIASVTIAVGAVIENAIGGSGGDGIFGNASANRLSGGAGADTIDGAAGGDLLYGDAGDDRLTGGLDADVLVGGAGGDLMFGGEGDDLLGGQDDGDYIEGGEGRDTLLGEAGADTLVGGAGGDVLVGGEGDDLMGGQDGDDLLQGEGGADTLLGEAGRDILVGGAGDDRMVGAAGDDLLGGQDGDDLLDGNEGVDVLLGEAGRDILVGGADADQMYGGEGDDLMGGQDGDDYLQGDGGADTLLGEGGRDILVGGAGDDAMFGHDGDDLMGGQDGDDRLEAGEGADTLFGEAGVDVLVGGGGVDLLFGGEGDDDLSGGDGPDRLLGQGGGDRLRGGGGADVFDLGATGAGTDTVLDFDRTGGDRIDLGGLRFAALTRADVDGDGRVDSVLDYAGGRFVALGVAELTLDGWNTLVI